MNLTVGKRPIFVEFLGPAGAGKTTLIKTLCQNNTSIVRARKPTVRDIRNWPFFLNNSRHLMPVFLEQRPNNRWLTWQEMWWMLYLNGWHRELGRQTSNGTAINVMDHGPIYMLSSLLEFGPEITQSQRFQEWWSKIFRQWTLFLDMVIWLDAPNSVLAKRINARDSRHIVKGKSEQEIYKFLGRYRTSFEQQISLSKAMGNSLRVLCFHTDQETPQQIADEIHRVCDMRLEDVRQQGG